MIDVYEGRIKDMWGEIEERAGNNQDLRGLIRKLG